MHGGTWKAVFHVLYPGPTSGWAIKLVTELASLSLHHTCITQILGLVATNGSLPLDRLHKILRINTMNDAKK